MNLRWEITSDDVARIQDFYRRHEGSLFVRKRIEKTSNQLVSAVTLESFWFAMISCLLTTQQQSGPKSHVSRFIATRPFPLRYELCREQADLEVFVSGILSEFGGLRRFNTIAKAAKANLLYLKGGGWIATSAVLDELRVSGGQKIERGAARFVDEKYEGFGPKQSRNLLQMLGLSRFEIPIDSRATKWLKTIGYPIALSANLLSDRDYFELVLDGFQRLAEASGILPSVLDAAIFSSFDDEEWTQENAVW